VRLSIFVFCVWAAVTTGCTHVQLRHNTVRQAKTISDIYQQQVLDNLAKFARDPNALPHFAVATGGFSDVTDVTEGGLTAAWNATRFTGAGLASAVNRGMKQNWTLVPVNDPRKLELMRCAYQKAVACCRGRSSYCCPECSKRFKNFYTGNDNEEIPLPCTEESNGTITSCCLNSGWLKVGCKRCIHKFEKRDSCCLIGTHCRCHVCVSLGVGTDELTKLTIAILDFAINDPPAIRTKEVTAYLDGDGGPANSKDAAFVVTAALPITAGVKQVLTEQEKEISRLRAPFYHQRQLLERAFEGQRLQGILPAPASDTDIDKDTGKRPMPLEAPVNLPSIQDLPTTESPDVIRLTPRPSFRRVPQNQLFLEQLQRVRQ